MKGHVNPWLQKKTEIQGSWDSSANFKVVGKYLEKFLIQEKHEPPYQPFSAAFRNTTEIL